MSEMFYKVPESWSACAHVNAAKYHEMYAHSVRDPQSFWGEHGHRIDWIKHYSCGTRTSFAPGNVSIEWFRVGISNVSITCTDRQLAKRADQIPLISARDDTKASQSIT